MGNREDLLAGARHCLEEKGWARITVRDIAAASNVSMAAIGYHFGSREALLTAALIEAIDEWGTRLGRTLSAYGTADASEAERYEALWAAVIRSFTDDRTLWLATLEALVQAEHSDDLRRYLSGGQIEGRRGLAALLLGRPEDEIDDATARTLGAAQLALFTGLMTQWLTDPDQAPRAPEVVTGLRALGGIVGPRA
ncbi:MULTISPECIES: TetR/AcrR family transcriptional regulator [Streptomyces]|uniref:TetR family transcriptional regulator n=1 Tax=Streptomyces venezuelae TaxID=54571 RepID=A0A5P2CHQ8_STRVZ|nr:TetR/AcrR family transcriptional regulator [Streptomyces venezuelae]QES42374.1 TetR family transcriptional regulator [Streptomyces venezuelae]